MLCFTLEASGGIRKHLGGIRRLLGGRVAGLGDPRLRQHAQVKVKGSSPGARRLQPTTRLLQEARSKMQGCKDARMLRMQGLQGCKNGRIRGFRGLED